MTSINLGLSRAQSWSRWHQWVICLLAMVVMAGLHLTAAAQKSFWEDEAVTAHYIEADFQRAVYADAKFHPPLYYVISFAWARLLGNSELAIRSFSVFLACITLVLGFRVTQLLFGGPSAIAFCILMALSPMWLTYGPQARYYASVGCRGDVDGVVVVAVPT
ncbi:MAG: hypothetical protein HC853_11885 [Anaerolineae bacterium]|nr:hypothetical protein [Anaerolineae bacterium]